MNIRVLFEAEAEEPKQEEPRPKEDAAQPEPEEAKPARERAYKTLKDIPIMQFNYSSPDSDPKTPHDPKPLAIVFGLFEHYNTHNILVCAINLHYMDANQQKRFAMYAKEIVEGATESIGEAETPKRTLQDIWATGKRLMPDVFGGKAYDGGRGSHAYRTYRQDRIKGPKRKADLHQWCEQMGVEPIKPEKPKLEPEKPRPPVKPEKPPEKPPVEKPPEKPPVEKPPEKPPEKPVKPEPEPAEKPEPPEIDWGEIEVSIRPPKEKPKPKPKERPERPEVDKIEAEFEPEPEPPPEDIEEIEMD